MRVEYVYANNTRFQLSIVASSTDHQIKLVISSYEALCEGFPTLVFVPNSVANIERNNKIKFSSSLSPLHCCFFFLSPSLSL